MWQDLSDLTSQDLTLLISAEKKGNSKAAVTQGQDNPNTKPDPTWVHEIFQGTLTNETRCLNCETVSERRDIWVIFFF